MNASKIEMDVTAEARAAGLPALRVVADRLLWQAHIGRFASPALARLLLPVREALGRMGSGTCVLALTAPDGAPLAVTIARDAVGYGHVAIGEPTTVSTNARGTAGPAAVLPLPVADPLRQAA